MSKVVPDLTFLPSRLLLDGGFGTALIGRGLDVSAESPAAWSLTRPAEVLAVHKEFAAAGAGALQTNTFGANRLALGGRGASYVRDCNLASARLAREAAGPGSLVAGCLGPSGLIPPPQGDADLQILEETFGEQARLLSEGGVDFLQIETMAHPKEMRAALRGARVGAPSLAVMVSMVTRLSSAGYKTTLGFSIESMLQVAREEGAQGIGVNCMLTPDDMLSLVQWLVETVSVPVFAKPTNSPGGGRALSTEVFADGVAKLFEAGARAVGGCCGTTPDDIACAAQCLDD